LRGAAATKQSSFLALQEKLDCFAALAMTERFAKRRKASSLRGAAATKQSSFFGRWEEKLDCFAALAMTERFATTEGLVIARSVSDEAIQLLRR
jgi:hypothetical protein